jgi:hypothetical protein
MTSDFHGHRVDEVLPRDEAQLLARPLLHRSALHHRPRLLHLLRLLLRFRHFRLRETHPPGVSVIKLSYLSPTVKQNKLECLSLASLSNLAYYL